MKSEQAAKISRALMGNKNGRGQKNDKGIWHLLSYDVDDPKYKPQNFLSRMQELLNASDDAKLSRVLCISNGVLSRVRYREEAISPALWLRLHDLTGLTIKELRDMAGVTIYADKE